MKNLLLFIVFVTLSLPSIEQTVTDINGNVYNTVIIGTQVWMKENLKTTKFNDGTAILLVPNMIVWDTITTPGYCWYNNDSATYANPYGALYNGYTANSGKLCPTGWHVPTGAEWSTLVDYLAGWPGANDKLKETGTTHWLCYNTEATNESGFTGLPGGCYTSYSGFMEVGCWGRWFDNFYLCPDNAPPLQLMGGNNGVSVRCVNDNKASITNSINSEEVILYPNPATEKLYLKNGNYANGTVMIFDLQGKQVLSQQMDSNPIDISNLEKGIYVVKLVSSANVRITKSIKE